MDKRKCLESFWRYPDEQQAKLLHSLKQRVVVLATRLQEILDHLASAGFDGYLSGVEKERLLSNIQEGRLDELDMCGAVQGSLSPGRKKITRRREAEMLFLLAFLNFQNQVEKESHKTFLQIARQKNQEQGNAEPITSDLVDAWLKMPLPDGGIFWEDLQARALYESQQMARKTEAIWRQGQKLLVDTPLLKRFLEAERNWLLSASSNGGYRGYLDAVMAGITGHTVLFALKARGVEEVEFVAVLDDRTTDACRRLDGKIFPIQELKLGKNAPPIYPPPHPCRSALRALSTTGQLRVILEKYKGYGELFSGIEGDFAGLSEEAVGKTLLEIAKVLQDFPELQGCIKEFGVIGAGVMATRPLDDFSGVTMRFNIRFYQDAALIRRAFQADQANGGSPAGARWTQVGVHEMGHVALFKIIRNSHSTTAAMIEDWNHDDTARRIVEQAYRASKIQLPLEDAVQQISFYAQESKAEAVGEAFLDWYANGEKAHTLSKAIVEEVKAWL